MSDKPLTRADDLRPLVGAVGKVLHELAWLVQERIESEGDPAWTEEDVQALASFAQTNTAAIKYLGTKIDQLQQAEATVAAAMAARPPGGRLN